VSTYHFIAIGGAVMHNLALELHALGHSVSGSDDEIFDPASSRLKASGLLPEDFGWFPERISDKIDAVILGMHAKLDNPELQKAQKLGIPIFSFPEFIYEHAKNKTRVVIAGSHGKTTSTAMLMHILQKEEKPFDYLVGSLISGYDRMVKLSDAPLIIIEGDEYLSSPLDSRSKFLHYQPDFAMITGVAWDHVNVFPTWESYVGTFKTFISQISKKCIYYSGDSTLKSLENSNPNSLAYQAPNFESKGAGTNVEWEQGCFQYVPFFGKHNIENAAGVVELANCLGIEKARAWDHLSDFPGTSKRLECIFENESETVFRDFAHAPSKVEATVTAVRNQFREHYFLSVFELHTYSSLQPEFMQGYKGLFDSADSAWVLYDPHVFELKRMEIPTKEEIQERLGNVRLFNDPKELANALSEWRADAHLLGKPTVSLWMSSGNFGGVKIV